MTPAGARLYQPIGSRNGGAVVTYAVIDHRLTTSADAQGKWGKWLAAAALAAAAASLPRACHQPDPPPAAGFAAQDIGGPFTLSDPAGHSVTDATLAGKPYTLYFGYTRCPDICPTSLSRMARLRQRLGPAGNRFNIVFVSVDPAHDTPAFIGRYVQLFGTPIIGLTGTEAQLTTIEQAYHVFVRHVPLPGGDYTIDHSAEIYLMDANGRFVGAIEHNDSDEAAFAKLRRLVD